MTYDAKNWDEMYALARAVISGRIPGADMSEGGDYDTSARLWATMFTGNQSQGQYLANQIIGSKAEGDFLVEHLKARGLSLELAAKARGSSLLTADGGGCVQAAGSVVTAPDGTTYALDADATANANAFVGGPYQVVQVSASMDRVWLSPDADLQISGGGRASVVSINGIQRAVQSYGPAGAATPTFVELYEPLGGTPGAYPGAAVSAAVGVIAAVTSSEAGAATNNPPNTRATLASPATNAGHTFDAAVVLLDVSGGSDDMTEEQGRAQISAFDSQRPQAGNPQWYRELALKTPGVQLEDAVFFPSRIMHGFHELYVIGKVARGRQVSDATVQAVQDWIDANAIDDDQIFVKSLALDTPTNVAVTITPVVGYEPDWGAGSGDYFSVPSFDPTAGAFTLSADASSKNLRPGDRVTLTLADAGIYTWHQQKVLRVSGANVWVDETFSSNATVCGPRLYPGGPLSQPVADAVIALFDSFGPSSRDAGGIVWRRRPDPTELWDDGLRIGKLVAAAMSVQGVQSAQYTGSDVFPASGLTAALGALNIAHA